MSKSTVALPICTIAIANKNSTLEGQASLLYTEYYKNGSYMVATFDWINNVFNCYYFVPNGPNN